MLDKNKKSRKEKNSKNYTRNYLQQKMKKKKIKGGNLQVKRNQERREKTF